MSPNGTFPSTPIAADPMAANQQNYLAWRAQHVQRLREMRTHFAHFQGRSAARMYRNIQLRETLTHDTTRLDELMDSCERQLSGACDCETCCREQSMRRRSLGDASSLRSSLSGSVSSLASLKERDSEKSGRVESPGSGELKGLPKSKSGRRAAAENDRRSVAAPVP